jgi:hypothetical protein
MKKMAKGTMKWFDHAKNMPLGLFFTTMGPIIGKVDKAPADMGQFRVRIWAPAMVQIGFLPPDKAAPEATSVQQRVVFQPLALIETHIDLSTAAPFGRAPVPDSLVASYEEYFAKFIDGEYSLRRVVAKVETGAGHEVTPPEPLPAPEQDDSEMSESEDSTVS